MSGNTTIEISKDTWRELNSYKEVGDSFDRVLRRVLGLSTDIQVIEEIEAIGEHNKETTG